jgi:hypothetical protein
MLVTVVLFTLFARVFSWRDEHPKQSIVVLCGRVNKNEAGDV